MSEIKTVCAHQTVLNELIWSPVNSSPYKLVSKCPYSRGLAESLLSGLGLHSVHLEGTHIFSAGLNSCCSFR